MIIDFSDLDKVGKNLKKKGYKIEEALLFVAYTADKDFNSAISTEEYMDSKSDREITITISTFGRRKK